jgi:coenzyme F420-0:L-glutamate ligase/coenzyme F420-1:gamma-L-glutamate ligase
MTLTLTPLNDIPLIRQNDDLADIILNSLEHSNITLADNDIFVLAQKVVSKAEGRMINLESVKPSERAKELASQIEKDARLVELILRESNSVLRTRPGTIIVEHKLGFICANAGIDHSNVAPLQLPPHMTVSDFGGVSQSDEGEAGEYVLLLPKNPDQSANEIRTKIELKTHKKVGVMIIDSHGRAWRIGTEGVCIGLSGIPGVMDERGWQDLFGYTLRITVVGVADELAAAASLVMGQAAEGTPIVHVRGFPYPLREGSLKELIRPKEQDLFR